MTLNDDLSEAREDMCMRRGTSFEQTLTVLDGDGMTVDLTGCSATETWYHLLTGAEAYQHTVSTGRVTLGGVGGTVARVFSDEYTATLESGDYERLLTLSWPDGRTDALSSGFVAVVN